MPPFILDLNDENSDELLSGIGTFYDSPSDYRSADEEPGENSSLNGARCRRRHNTLRTSQRLPDLDSNSERRIPEQLDNLDSVPNNPSESSWLGCPQETLDAGDLQPRLEGNGCKLSDIRSPSLAYPKSRYEGHIPLLPKSRERHVVKEFLECTENEKSRNEALDGENFTEFELSDFTIYLPGDNAFHKWEMRGLQTLATKGASSYCFDGILSCGNIQRYVQCVPFKICSIGRYGREFDTIGDEIWVQSLLNHKTDIYYRLKAPSSEYGRYHQGFLWLANLAKHFVDFAKGFTDQEEKLSIHNFRSDFSCWLERTHGRSSAYRSWYSKHNSRDFRRAVATNIEFLWKEYIGTDPESFKHPLWSQVKDMNFVAAQPVKEKKTIVTPYVFDCFSHLKFGHHLKKVVLDGQVATRRKSQGHVLHLTVDADLQDSAEKSLDQRDLVVSASHYNVTNKMRERKLDRMSIVVGDVLGVIKDSKTRWKDEASKWKTLDECWWVLVQGIYKNKQGKPEFDVIWLYKPSDTSCAKMRYPYHDELFLSDNCNCGEARITEEEVLCKATVSWHRLPRENHSDFFIRQTFLHDNSFVTLQEAHKQCFHLHERNEGKTPFQEAVSRYQVGDTVLIVPSSSLKSKHDLEPVEVAEFIPQGNTGILSVRRLLRRVDVDKSTRARPNELVYTDQFSTIKIEQVARKCLVKFYTEHELVSRDIPAPYSRDGTGNAFYITSRLFVTPDGAEYLHRIEDGTRPSLFEGFDPKAAAPRERLRGLDLYCGGGNFGRGLEEGGAVQMTHAVDLAGNAIHTYHANQKDSESTKLFWGSVDDVLYEAMRNNPSNSDLIPLPGMIEFLSAGSPCQGYSLLNASRGNETGLKNQSLVASVAAYVDVYRPKYALLENVTSMAQKGKGRDEDVLSQLICCLVGMGYQVQLFLLDAWSCGSPQSRSRLFVAMAAPGLTLPDHPELSHSHPAGTSTRGLGQGANGLSFGQRRFEPTPFEFLTASEATEDLPDIGDARDDHCTEHPDHRITCGMSQRLKTRIELIPRYPREMNFVLTRKANLLLPSELQMFPLVRRDGRQKESVGSNSRAWGRLHPQKLFPTIATSLVPMDARTGRSLHWDQHRLLTVMEARRAQSFPDEEVLTGIPTKQWKIVGNSVARTISLALGLSLRKAWLSNPLDDDPGAYEVAIRLQKTVKSGQQLQQETEFRAQSFDNKPLTTDDAVESYTDEAALSDEHYRRSLNNSGWRSSASRDELTSSGNSTPLSGLTDVKGKKRQRKDETKLTSMLAERKKAKSERGSNQPSKLSKYPVPAKHPQGNSKTSARKGSYSKGANPQGLEVASLKKALKDTREEQKILAAGKGTQ